MFDPIHNILPRCPHSMNLPLQKLQAMVCPPQTLNIAIGMIHVPNNEACFECSSSSESPTMIAKTIPLSQSRETTVAQFTRDVVEKHIPEEWLHEMISKNSMKSDDDDDITHVNIVYGKGFETNIEIKRKIPFFGNPTPKQMENNVSDIDDQIVSKGNGDVMKISMTLAMGLNAKDSVTLCQDDCICDYVNKWLFHEPKTPFSSREMVSERLYLWLRTDICVNWNHHSESDFIQKNTNNCSEKVVVKQEKEFVTDLKRRQMTLWLPAIKTNIEENTISRNHAKLKQKGRKKVKAWRKRKDPPKGRKYPPNGNITSNRPFKKQKRQPTHTETKQKKVMTTIPTIARSKKRRQLENNTNNKINGVVSNNVKEQEVTLPAIVRETLTSQSSSVGTITSTGKRIVQRRKRDNPPKMPKMVLN